MASERKTKENTTWGQYVRDNKYVIGGIGAALSVGALAFYALKSSAKRVPPSSHNVHDRSTVKKVDCGACGIGIEHSSPMNAFLYGKREKLLYTTATRTDNVTECEGGDFVAVVDVDPSSKTYCQIIHQVALGKNEEVHHSGWNACASCYGMDGVNRKYLVVPAFTSGNIHFIDISNPKQPALKKTVSGQAIKERFGLSYPHTAHCLASGKLLISFLGVDGRSKGVDFLLFNGRTLEPESKWIANEKQRPQFGYDFWYQPYHNIMISTEWGTPKAFSKGFDPEHVSRKMYGSSIHFWDWDQRRLLKTETFDASKVVMPLEIRFLHDPRSVHAVCGAALTSNVIHIWKDSQGGDWRTDTEWIRVDPIRMSKWKLPAMPGLVTDVLISMDDKFLYFSNWLHGDVRQYDISDPMRPRLHSQCFVGGSLRADAGYEVADKEKNPPPVVPKVRGKRLEGGPQMLQLSLDGKRLYVTNSLYSAYDQQFYPDLVRNGGQMMRIDIDLEHGGKMKLNTDFLVDFGECKGGPARPHEMRYQGGDCTSDIFLVQ